MHSNPILVAISDSNRTQVLHVQPTFLMHIFGHQLDCQVLHLVGKEFGRRLWPEILDANVQIVTFVPLRQQLLLKDAEPSTPWPLNHPDDRVRVEPQDFGDLIGASTRGFRVDQRSAASKGNGVVLCVAIPFGVVVRKHRRLVLIVFVPIQTQNINVRLNLSMYAGLVLVASEVGEVVPECSANSDRVSFELFQTDLVVIRKYDLVVRRNRTVVVFGAAFVLSYDPGKSHPREPNCSTPQFQKDIVAIPSRLAGCRITIGARPFQIFPEQIDALFWGPFIFLIDMIVMDVEVPGVSIAFFAFFPRTVPVTPSAVGQHHHGTQDCRCIPSSRTNRHRFVIVR
mmetsp:Transcript_6908/g.19993  ORF Transcript_6908/g.19993 Transcript_6908/m.19993 type:complete len:341 (+) Transcript_6908:2506-3528(+)